MNEVSTTATVRDEVASSGPGRVDRTRDPLISVAGVWKVFGPHAERIIGTPAADLSRAELREQTGCITAVRDVSFQVWPGEVFVVMGLSGSGKSTLVRTLVRLIEPTAGTVQIAGRDVTAANADELRTLRRGTVAMVFQHFGLLSHRRVIENVAFGLEVKGVSKQERTARAQQMVELVGLSGFENQYPDQLSGGMQQRVGLARAFALDPQVLLFDEPFSALDPLIRRDMQDEVIRLQAETGKTMVFITHDLSEALRLGDRIMIMRPPTAADDMTGPAVPVETIVREAVPMVAASDRPLRAVADGKVVGIVDRVAVLNAFVPQEA